MNQLSESLSGVDATVAHSTPTSALVSRGTAERVDLAEGSFITEEGKDGTCLTVPNNTWRSNSSDSDWRTTTDTSIHSSLSATHSIGDIEVPPEVLEACDGMDDASSPSPQVVPGRGKVVGRTVARKRRRVKRRESSVSSSSRSCSSEDLESGSSSSYDTATSSYSACSSSSTCSRCSSCSCSSYSSCSCSDSSCSCSEHSDTSYESTDELTDLPRAKTRARRLGKKASLKVADKCNQS